MMSKKRKPIEVGEREETMASEPDNEELINDKASELYRWITSPELQPPK